MNSRRRRSLTSLANEKRNFCFVSCGNLFSCYRRELKKLDAVKLCVQAQKRNANVSFYAVVVKAAKENQMLSQWSQWSEEGKNRIKSIHQAALKRSYVRFLRRQLRCVLIFSFFGIRVENRSLLGLILYLTTAVQYFFTLRLYVSLGEEIVVLYMKMDGVERRILMMMKSRAPKNEKRITVESQRQNFLYVTDISIVSAQLLKRSQ